MRRASRNFSVLAFFVLGTFSPHAQFSGSIEGIVQDPSGAGVAQGGVTGSQANVGGVDVNLTAPTTFNYAAILEHKLIGNLGAGVGYIVSRSYNLITG